MNSATPNPITFPSASTGTLSLNGHNATIPGVNSAGAGTPRMNNASATPATLTINGGGFYIYNGTIADGAGGGALGVNVNMANTNFNPAIIQGFSGNNSYSGGTTITQGILAAAPGVGSHDPARHRPGHARRRSARAGRAAAQYARRLDCKPT